MVFSLFRKKREKEMLDLSGGEETWDDIPISDAVKERLRNKIREKDMGNFVSPTQTPAAIEPEKTSSTGFFGNFFGGSGSSSTEKSQETYSEPESSSHTSTDYYSTDSKIQTITSKIESLIQRIELIERKIERLERRKENS